MLILDEYGAFLADDQVDIRQLLYISDKTVKDRQDRIQKQKAAQASKK